VLREDEGRNLTVFGGVKNLFDTYGDPNTIAYILSSPTNFAFYDAIGRQFQVGLRFKY
jgi:outer membrane receptor protein involved in Fe transport